MQPRTLDLSLHGHFRGLPEGMLPHGLLVDWLLHQVCGVRGCDVNSSPTFGELENCFVESYCGGKHFNRTPEIFFKSLLHIAYLYDAIGKELQSGDLVISS